MIGAAGAELPVDGGRARRRRWGCARARFRDGPRLAGAAGPAPAAPGAREGAGGHRPVRQQVLPRASAPDRRRYARGLLSGCLAGTRMERCGVRGGTAGNAAPR